MAMTVSGIVVFGVGYGVGIFKSNPAQKQVQPLITAITQLGGQKICETGDNGQILFSEDTQPSYAAYYKVSDSGLENKLKDVATANDLSLSAGTLPVSANPQATYLEDELSSGGMVRVVIDKNGPMTITCSKSTSQQNATDSIDLVQVSAYLRSAH